MFPKSNKPALSGKAQRVAAELRFTRNWLTKPVHTGSITPTGKAASRLMASFVSGDNNRCVLELGPGTGPVTRAILETGLSPDRLTCVEYNSEFCRHLTRNFNGVNIVQGDAFDLDNTLGIDHLGKFSAVLSGLPLLNFPREQRSRYIEDALRYAAADAPFVQLCYGPKAPFDFADNRISCESTRWVLANVPPARFWVYRKRAV